MEYVFPVDAVELCCDSPVRLDFLHQLYSILPSECLEYFRPNDVDLYQALHIKADRSRISAGCLFLTGVAILALNASVDVVEASGPPLLLESPRRI